MYLLESLPTRRVSGEIQSYHITLKYLKNLTKPVNVPQINLVNTRQRPSPCLPYPSCFFISPIVSVVYNGLLLSNPCLCFMQVGQVLLELDIGLEVILPPSSSTLERLHILIQALDPGGHIFCSEVSYGADRKGECDPHYHSLQFNPFGDLGERKGSVRMMLDVLNLPFYLNFWKLGCWVLVRDRCVCVVV